MTTPLRYSSVDAIEALGLPPGRWVDADGPVHYREWEGPEAGPKFVCVHGLGGSHLNWAPVAPALARHGRVLALDLAGFGLTPPAGRETGIGANRRLLDAFMRALDLPPVVLIGNSMGGMLAVVQAAHAPRSVERLILVDAALPRVRSLRGQPTPRIAAMFALYASSGLGRRLVESRARRLGPEGLVRETLRLAAADPSSIDPNLRAALVELARQRTDFDYAAKAFLSAARSIFRSQAFPAKYRQLVRGARTPALVIHGAQDALVPVAAAREAVALHPNWKLVVFDDLGHIPQMEAPARFMHAVEEWLTEGDRADQAAVDRS